jgi:hypothetical protein
VGLFVSADGDPHFLQKEAGKSVLECHDPKFSGRLGRRVVEGQHVMQASSDIFLGCSQDNASGRHFYVRELKNRRLGATSELIEENALLTTHICAAARSLALMHAPPIRRCLLDTWERAVCSTPHWRPLPWLTRTVPSGITINWQAASVRSSKHWPHNLPSLGQTR